MDTRIRPMLRDLMLAVHKHSHVRRPKASKSSATLADIADERSEFIERDREAFWVMLLRYS